MAGLQEDDSDYDDDAVVLGQQPPQGGPAPKPWRGPQLKIEKFGGSRSKYRAWRNEVQALVKLHTVPEEK